MRGNESGSCIGCAANEKAWRIFRISKVMIKELENEYPPGELSCETGPLADGLVEGCLKEASAGRYMALLLVKREVSGNFLIDAAQTCPGLTRSTFLGIPGAPRCGMPDYRREELSRYQ